MFGICPPRKRKQWLPPPTDSSVDGTRCVFMRTKSGDELIFYMENGKCLVVEANHSNGLRTRAKLGDRDTVAVLNLISEAIGPPFDAELAKRELTKEPPDAVR